MQLRIHTFVACTLLFPATGLLAQELEIYNLGLVDSIVKDLSPGKKKLLESEFPDLVKEFTGLNSKVVQGGAPITAAKKLAASEWHLGVFQGVEFAWAQAADEKLQPLLLAVKGKGNIHALLVGKKDGELEGFADLKAKDVYILQGREHCRLFADKATGGDAKEFFGKLTPTGKSLDALDDILRGKIDAAIVDDAALEVYQDLQPGRFAKLKVLAKSESFPPTVIAYRPGVLSEGAVKKFRAGMIKANESTRGREAMADVGIRAFQEVPADFAKLLADIRKAYPAPTK
jgi:TRAP-type uncharacterized transport system substrate-binding protein